VGRTLYFEDLRPGRHVITLRVSDSDGFVAEDRVTILIGQRVYLPIVRR